MARVDHRVFIRFCERFSDRERSRLEDLYRAHHLKHCPVVEALRGVARGDAWFDASPYAGDVHRFSARFIRPLGGNVNGGGEVRADGTARRWSTVSGEFNAR